MALFPTNEEQLQEAQKKATTTPQQKLGSGTFTNLQNYLKSNVGAGQRIAGKIGEDTSKKASTATTATTEAQGVGAAIQAQQDRADKALGISKDIEGVASGKTPLMDLSAKEKEAKYYTGGDYAKEAEGQRTKLGETLVAGQKAVGALGQRAEALGTEKGRYDILSDVYRRPTYGAGQQRLDQLLLQQQGSNALIEAMKQGKTQAAQQGEALSSTMSSGTTGLADILSKGGQAAKGILGAASSGLSSLEQAEETERKGKETEQLDLYEKLKSGMQGLKADESGNIMVSPELQAMYKQATGQDLGGGQEVFNLFDNPAEATNWLQKKNLDLNAFVSQEDIDKMDLMSRLGGGISKKYTTAGTSPTSLFSGSFDEATKAAKEKFEKEAAEQVFTGTGTGYRTGSERAGGDLVGGLLGTPSSTSYGYKTASSSVADYLKDPEILPKRVSSIQQDIGTQRQNNEASINAMLARASTPEGQAEEYQKRISSGGMFGETYQTPEARASAMRDQFEAGLADELSSLSSEQSLQSQIKDYLNKKGYGRRLVLGTNKPKESIMPQPTTSSGIKGGLK